VFKQHWSHGKFLFVWGYVTVVLEPAVCYATCAAAVVAGSGVESVARKRVTGRMNRTNAPCRLQVYLAQDAPIGLVLRRGPAAWARLSLWHTDTDIFKHGQ